MPLEVSQLLELTQKPCALEDFGFTIPSQYVFRVSCSVFSISCAFVSQRPLEELVAHHEEHHHHSSGMLPIKHRLPEGQHGVPHHIVRIACLVRACTCIRSVALARGACCELQCCTPKGGSEQVYHIHIERISSERIEFSEPHFHFHFHFHFHLALTLSMPPTTLALTDLAGAPSLALPYDILLDLLLFV